MADQSYGDWKDWLLCLGVTILLEVWWPRIDKNPERHSPKWWRKHPQAIQPLRAVMSTTTKKDQLSRGDTWTILGVLLGVLFVIIVPPLYAKIPIFIAVCIGLVWMAHCSHWTVGWTQPQKAALAFFVVIICCAIAIPQFISQSRLEHPASATITAQREEPLVDPPLIVSDAEKLPNVDLSKRSLIRGGTGDGYFCRPGNGGITEIHLMISLVDLGLPTALGGWKLHYESERLNQWFGYINIDDNDSCTQPGGEGFKFDSSEEFMGKFRLR